MEMAVVELIMGILLLVLSLGLVVAVMLQSGKDKKLSGAIAGGADHIGELGVLEGLGAHNDSLMGSVARKLVESHSRDVLNGNPALLQTADDAVECRVSLTGRRGDHGAFKRHARRERLLHGTTALDEVSPGAATTGIGPLARARGLLLRVPRPALGPRVLLALALVSLGALGAAAPAPAGGVPRSAARRLGAALPSCHG